jgi:hypothetical protein
MYINEPNNNTTWDDWYIELYEEYLWKINYNYARKKIRQIATINKNWI